MAENTAVVRVVNPHAEAVATIKELQRSGFDIDKLSIVGKDYHSEQQVIGTHNAYDRMKDWEKLGAFWGNLWGLLSRSAFFFIPGIAHKLLCVVTDAFAKEVNMYTTHVPAHQSRSPQPVSVGRDPWYERGSDPLTEQFFGPVSLATVCPEAGLMCAVLEDAFLCFQKRFETEMRCIEQAREAEEWFFSDDSHGLFSFVSICTVLGLEPEFIRKRLKHWSRSHLEQARRKI